MKNITSLITGSALSLALIFGAEIASADTVSGSGTFKGASKHITSGEVSVVKMSNGEAVIKLGDSFKFDGAPDPVVGMGKNGKYDASTNLGKLAKSSGQQNYVIPNSIDSSKYNEVYIWCKQYGVPLGVASLK